MTFMVIGEGVRKVYEEVLVPAGMGDVAHLHRAWKFHDGTVRMSGYQGNP